MHWNSQFDSDYESEIEDLSDGESTESTDSEEYQGKKITARKGPNKKSPIVLIKVEGKYIRSNSEFVLHSDLCPIHEKLGKGGFDITNLLEFIFEYFQNKKIIESFNLENINTSEKKVYMICLLDAVIECMINRTDNYINYDLAVINFCKSIIFGARNKINQIDRYIDFQLKMRVTRFATLLPNCTCVNTLKFDRNNTSKYKIYDRFDLVKKMVENLQDYTNLEDRIKSTLESIQNGLRQHKIKFLHKKLINIPYHLWTEILENHFGLNEKIYIDQDNKLVHNINSNNTIMYLHETEKDPSKIYEINICEHPFCILCDNPWRKFPQEISIDSVNTINIVRNVPNYYFCDQICTVLKNLMKMHAFSIDFRTF